MFSVIFSKLSAYRYHLLLSGLYYGRRRSGGVCGLLLLLLLLLAGYESGGRKGQNSDGLHFNLN